MVTLDANYNDMLVALGEGKKLVATGYRGNDFDGFDKDLGVNSNYDARRLTYLSSGGGTGFDKEVFYALHADVHHIDPLQLAAVKGWSRADVDEISRNVGPFFANRYSRDNNYAGKSLISIIRFLNCRPAWARCIERQTRSRSSRRCTKKWCAKYRASFRRWNGVRA